MMSNKVVNQIIQHAGHVAGRDVNICIQLIVFNKKTSALSIHDNKNLM